MNARWKLNPVQQFRVFAKPEGYMRFDTQHKFVMISPVFTDYFGWEQEQVLGRYPHEFVLGPSAHMLVAPDVPGGVMTDFWPDMERRILAGETVYHELPIQTRDGDEKWIAATGRAVYDAEGYDGWQVGFSLLDNVISESLGDDGHGHFFGGVQAMFGKRLREVSLSQLNSSVHALRAGDGGTVVLRVPPNEKDPVEVSFWDYDGEVRFVETF